MKPTLEWLEKIEPDGKQTFSVSVIPCYLEAVIEHSPASGDFELSLIINSEDDPIEGIKVPFAERFKTLEAAQIKIQSGIFEAVTGIIPH